MDACLLKIYKLKKKKKNPNLINRIDHVTPDKRKNIYLFSDESSILLAMREALEEIYSPSNACYSVNKVEEHTEGGHSFDNMLFQRKIVHQQT
jgi:hypothetical protein